MLFFTNSAWCSEVDTNKHVLYTYTRENPNQQILDTEQLDNFHQYNFTLVQNNWNQNLGNTGLASFPIIYTPNTSTNFSSGTIGYTVYEKTRNKLNYYYTNKPYVELKLTGGAPFETVFNGKHAQNVTKNFHIGIEYSRINSKGKYLHQAAEHNNVEAYTHLHTTNKKWHWIQEFVLNNRKTNENEGIKQDVFQNGISNPSLEVPYSQTAISKGMNYEYASIFRMQQNKIIQRRINDSITVKDYIPKASAEVEFVVGKEKNTFTNSSPDTALYKTFFPTTFFTFKNLYQENHVGANLRFVYHGLKSENDSLPTYRNIYGYVEASYINYSVQNGLLNPYDVIFNQAQVTASISSNPLSNSSLKYRAKAVYTLSGYNQNNTLLETEIAQKLTKIGTVFGGVMYQVKTPSVLQNFVRANEKTIDNQFRNTNTLKAQIGHQFLFQQFRVELNYLALSNYIYADTAYLFHQKTSTISAFQINASAHIRAQKFHIKPSVWVQSFSDKNTIPLPTLAAWTDVYYDNLVFKKNMHLQVGTFLRYNTPYHMMGYAPFVPAFYVQQETKYNSYIQADVYLKAQVKSLSICVKGENILGNIDHTGNYAALNYPTAYRTVRLLLNWKFLN